jgi:hypothetical protein
MKRQAFDVITPYFRALSQFEQCIATVAQAAKFAEYLLCKKLSKQGDQSALERLKRLYNASKHIEGLIASGTLPDKATTGLWIVNGGIEGSDTALTFDELCELLIGFHEFAKQVAVELPKQHQERTPTTPAT